MRTLLHISDIHFGAHHAPERARALLLAIDALARNWNARAGYEVSNWFQLISIPDFADDVNRGHLMRRQSNYSVDGFFFRLGYSY